MSLQKIVVLCVVVIAIAAAAWYVKSNSAEENIEPASAVNQNSPETINKTDSDTLTGVGSFAALLGLGQNITCDYSFSDEVGAGTGTGYFAGERMRVDSTMTTNDGVFDSHMINDGDFIYTWTSTSEGDFAVKIPIPEESADVDDSDYSYMDGDESGQFDVDQQVEYDCDRWSVDGSVFVPPVDIEFMDMSAMMQGMFDGMPEGFTMPEGMSLPQ